MLRSRKKKSNLKSSRRKKGVEKCMEEREDTIPWNLPNPNESLPYCDGLMMDNEEELGRSRVITLLDPGDNRSSVQFNGGVQKNSEKYFIGGGGVNNKSPYIMSSPLHHHVPAAAARGRYSPHVPTEVSSSYCFPATAAVMVPTAGNGQSLSLVPSGQDVCTLFQNACHIGATPPAEGKRLPPIGVFWDIENCSVPKGKSALITVQRIREKFFHGHYEAEFVCVCDIRKESPAVIQELNDAQVTVIHVSGNSKNAADDKLRQAMRRFADVYSDIPATVILISGDINFSSDLSDLRYRKRLYVILLHNKHASDALILCANEHYDFHTLLGNLPNRPTYRDTNNGNGHGHGGNDAVCVGTNGEPRIPLKGGLNAMDVLVCDLPHSNSKTEILVKKRLRKLSENCGGKVVTLQGHFALVRFPNKEAALRATKRMNGEDVLGSKIRVLYSSQMEFRGSNTQVPQVQIQPSQSQFPLIEEKGKMAQEPSNSNSDVFDLHVTNIDPNLGDWRNVRQLLISTFSEHVTVKGVWVYGSSEGSLNALVRVANKDEGHYAVAQLHRRKIGNKRIFISFDQGCNVDQDTLKKEVAALLQDVPGGSLPMFKFREMFEKRYRRSVSASDLYRLKDVVAICEAGPLNGGGGFNLGKTISLTGDWKVEDKNLSLYCSKHPPNTVASSSTSRMGWAEKEAEMTLPNVMLELKTLSSRVHSLMNSHDGSIPLISFIDCYEAEFEKIPVAEGGSGVPLEHLLACVQGVEIAFGSNRMKQLQLIDKTATDSGFQLPHAQPMATQLLQFGREMVDLLKTLPRCTLAFSKLIPAYHHHFGRQCRVADYGHFNLQSLLQTLPHVIQIMGASHNRVLTLSHRAQMKRFATDLLRVLKGCGGVKKQIKVSQFPEAFLQVFPTRQFFAEDYGLCYLSDLISELVENSTLVALVKDEDGDQALAVPKREQTPQEMHRTKLFASEVVDLFRNSIRYEMPFSKFIPSYHHHFGRQCRVSDYGFTKLAELFEAIGDTVIMLPPQGPLSDCTAEDRLLRLAPKEQIKVVGDHLNKLVLNETNEGRKVKLSDIEEIFMVHNGFKLVPEACGAEDTQDLVNNKLSSYLKVGGDGTVSAIDQNEVRLLLQDIISVLERHPNYTVDLDEFFEEYEETFGGTGSNNGIPLNLETLQSQLGHMLNITEEGGRGKRTIGLAPLRQFAVEMTQLLEENGGGPILISSVENLYYHKFGRPLRPAQLGFPSLISILLAIPDVIQIRGKHRAKKVFLVNGSHFSSGEEDSFGSSTSGSGTTSGNRSSLSLSSGNNNYGTPPPRNTGNGRRTPSSCDQYRVYNSLFKNNGGGGGTDRPCPPWTDPRPIPRPTSSGRAPPPPPLYIPSLASPQFPTPPQGRQHGRNFGSINNNNNGNANDHHQGNIFSFERAHSLPMHPSVHHHHHHPLQSPPVYDMWMQKPMSPVSPPLSPPMVWAYHPIMYPPNTPPANTANIMLPSFSFSSPWSPAPPLGGMMGMQPTGNSRNGHLHQNETGEHEFVMCE